MARKIDLHTHTTASDGSLTPDELVEKAVSLGFCAIAVTDHDTVDGVSPACARAEETDLIVIPGIELGTEHPGELHVLGLGIDINDPALLTILIALRDGRRERNRRMVDRLAALGLPVSWAEICEGRHETTIGRAHIARELVQKGVVDSTAQAFEKFIGEGKPAYVPRFRLTPKQAVDLIAYADGLSVLAHPVQLGLDEPSLYTLCRSLRDCGLWGIEAYHPSHDPDQTSMYIRFAGRLGLMITGGSDFHGDNKPDVELGDAVKQGETMEKALDALKAHACQRTAG